VTWPTTDADDLWAFVLASVAAYNAEMKAKHEADA
jgi:hypothetical protein